MKPLLDNREDLVNAAVSYLDAKRVTLWGTFDISKPEGLEAAAAWLAHECLGLLSELDP